jgi:hypothetical protein
MAMNPLAAAHRALRTYSLGLPAAYEDFPWGESAMKVAKSSAAFTSPASWAQRTQRPLATGVQASVVNGLNTMGRAPCGASLRYAASRVEAAPHAHGTREVQRC